MNNICIILLKILTLNKITLLECVQFHVEKIAWLIERLYSINITVTINQQKHQPTGNIIDTYDINEIS